MGQANQLLLFGIFLFHKIVCLEAGAQYCGIVPSSCPPITKVYRTVTGECNNQIKPWYGTILSEYDRLLPPNYADGNSSMPKAKSGKALPNARAVRVKCLPDDTLFQIEQYTTRLITPLSQFVAHDLSGLLLTIANFFVCCTEDMQILPNTPAYCINILLPSNDIQTLECNMTCMPMARTKTNYDQNCDLASPYAQQITTTTAFLDLDIVYGNTLAVSASLRVPNHYLLATEVFNGKDYPPNDPTKSTCPLIPSNVQEVCFRGGDKRMNQNPDITIQHILWVRAHNNIATKLKKLNPCWDNEKVFQEARKIVIALHQWFTFNEMLPEILGKSNMYQSGLTFESYYYLYINDYDPYCSPNVLNEFATAAFRVLHPFITGTLGLFNECRQPFFGVALRDSLARPQFTRNQFQPLLTGSLTQKAHKLGPDYDPEVTNRLFLLRKKYGLDLIAIDIQRSRDHGVPFYNDLRVYCGLPRPKNFSDLSDCMSAENIARLQSTYESVADIDGIVGGSLETPKSGAKVGPTFHCIITKQFLRVRRCDRFWFEHKEAGFSNVQLAEIRKTSLAGFICENGNDVDKMQLYALKPPVDLNSPIPCNLIYKLDLSYWKDYTCPVY
ncbi:peroxidase-like [Diabrotica virgifera virgifera]|uniref:Peroxidase-like n=2 Tax=Diabrotica virgifera virgifera TaxID=50390 RepID=A0ABM5K8P3_DIAVI|nr:peroxidase-like [Diabrotica virgifera virgifera]